MNGETSAGDLRADFPHELWYGSGIKVVGVGGGGINAVNRTIAADVKGVDYLAADTDSQALQASRAPFKIQLGAKLTEGLGCGGKPEIGRRAALEGADKIIEALRCADMAFVTTGLGGGTATGGASVFASLARGMGALTLAVATRPFAFEGEGRMQQAERGLADLCQAADAVISIPNECLMRFVDRETNPFEAFRLADDILRQGVHAISGMLTRDSFLRQDKVKARTVKHSNLLQRPLFELYKPWPHSIPRSACLLAPTFSDRKVERDKLQREVFPKLRQLCLSKGLRFQAIDLRWGVPEEAGKGNRTMRICLRELNGANP